MITKKVYVDYRGNVTQEFYCLSTDNKDDAVKMGAQNADPLIEMDTKKVFLRDAENQTWLPQ